MTKQELAIQGEGAAVLPADPMVTMIERVIMNPDADIDKLERMLSMKREIDAQNARVAFSSALSCARAEIPPIIKDATVDFTSNKGRTHYKHETLAGIAKQIDPILSSHGLTYRFRTEQGNGGVRVTCIVEHAHGHCEETSLIGPPDTSGNKNGFQAVGSAVTYLQRYTLKAALGLSAEVDDDAQRASPRPNPTQNRQSSQSNAAQNAADQMVTALRKHGLNVTNDARFKADLAKVKADFPAIAAQVEAEIQTLRGAERGPAGFGANDIPYEHSAPN